MYCRLHPKRRKAKLHRPKWITHQLEPRMCSIPSTGDPPSGGGDHRLALAEIQQGQGKLAIQESLE